MERKSITDIVGNAQTMQDAFSHLKGLKTNIANMSKNPFEVVESREGFALIKSEVGMGQERIMLHPYGTTLGYYI